MKFIKVLVLVVASVTLSACASKGPGQDADDCAVSNHRIIQSDAKVGVGSGNFLNRNRMDRRADYERERARRLNCGNY